MQPKLFLHKTTAKSDHNICCKLVSLSSHHSGILNDGSRIRIKVIQELTDSVSDIPEPIIVIVNKTLGGPILSVTYYIALK